MKQFEEINKGFANIFERGKLSLGIVVPIENYTVGSLPTMLEHLQRVKLAEEFGFKAIWLRDVPLYVPSFGDAGQAYDPFTYLGYLAGQTEKITLGIASVVLPLHHPMHVAKSAATIDQLSGGRLVLGIASGDRPSEYPAMGINFADRDRLFRETFSYIRAAQNDFPSLESSHYGTLNGQSDILPKPVNTKLPLLVTGHSRQSIDWIAENSDGWMYYPRNLYMAQNYISEFRNAIPDMTLYDKPFMQSLYVDLHEDDDYKPEPIHLGLRLGANHLVSYLKELQTIGVNHVVINLRFNTARIEETLEHFSIKILSQFH